MKYLGGYSILDLTDANVSAQANACYNQDKPVLVYGANGERYFADTITKSGKSFIITKGGKTITIANDNTITSEGDIIPNIMENIVDSQGNKRFIEGSAEGDEISGFTYTYSKWSLSGSHLMVVIAGSIEAGSTISSNKNIGIARDLPQWILNKIYPILSTYVGSADIFITENGVDPIDTWSCYISKSTNLSLVPRSGKTFTNATYLRVVVDLLIDNE